jgi:hypothetical protein
MAMASAKRATAVLEQTETEPVTFGSTKLTLNEIGKLRSFRRLSGQQAQWSLMYLKTSDPVQATQMAYGVDAERAKKDFYRYLNNSRIEEFLDDVQGVPQHERIARMLDRAARNKKTTASQIKALELRLTQLAGLSSAGSHVGR